MFGKNKLEKLNIWLYEDEYVMDVLKMINEIGDANVIDDPARVGRCNGAWFVRVSLSHDNASVFREWFNRNYNNDMGWFE